MLRFAIDRIDRVLIEIVVEEVRAIAASLGVSEAVACKLIRQAAGSDSERDAEIVTV